MERFVHRTVEVNGINMHLVEKGEGPVVLFLHGFPELWYSWRHQIEYLSNCGYHAVAPDLRGYGDTDAPSDINSYTCFQLVGDIVALIDYLGVDRVFLVGHDWGAALGWYLCQFRPDRIKAYVCLSVPFGLINKRDPAVKPIENFRHLFGDDYYICRFQEYPEMEIELAEAGTPYAIKNMLTNRDPGPIIFPKGKYPPGFNRHMPKDLPHWLTQPDLDVYISKFEKTRFTGGLNYYRNLDTNWELTAPWTGTGISKDIPVRFITGELDIVYTTPGIKEYVHGGSFKKDVPGLEDKIWVQPGVAHFNNQEAAADTNHLIHQFISKFNPAGIKEYVHDGSHLTIRRQKTPAFAFNNSFPTSDREKLASSKGKFAQYLTKILGVYFSYHLEAYDNTGVYLHDPTTILAAVDPSLLTYTEGAVRVQTSGITRGLTILYNKQKRFGEVTEWSDKPSVKVAVTVDAPAVVKLVMDRLMDS